MKQHPQYRFLGIAADSTRGDAVAFVKRYGWRWPQLWDPTRSLSRKLGAAWQPWVILIDARGRIVGALSNANGGSGAWARLAGRL